MLNEKENQRRGRERGRRKKESRVVKLLDLIYQDDKAKQHVCCSFLPFNEVKGIASGENVKENSRSSSRKIRKKKEKEEE